MRLEKKPLSPTSLAVKTLPNTLNKNTQNNESLKLSSSACLPAINAEGPTDGISRLNTVRDIDLDSNGEKNDKEVDETAHLAPDTDIQRYMLSSCNLERFETAEQKKKFVHYIEDYLGDLELDRLDYRIIITKAMGSVKNLNGIIDRVENNQLLFRKFAMQYKIEHYQSIINTSRDHGLDKGQLGYWLAELERIIGELKANINSIDEQLGD